MFKVDILGLRKNFLNIFDDPSIFIRELLQNSWEAILLRQKVDYNFAPSINVELINNLLTISDNGIGMSLKKMEEVLPYLFNSAWSNDEKWEGIGKFGMGMKSCFLMTNKLVVRSHNVDNNECWEWKIDLSSSDEYTFEKIENTTNNEPGTSITLELTTIDCGEKLIDAQKIIGSREKIIDKIRYYADFLPCPIIMDNIQINLAGMSGLDDVDYEPREWYLENYSELSVPLEVMPFVADFAKGVLFPVEKDTEKAEVVLYRMGLRIGTIRSDEIFSYFGHHIVGFIECPTFELYVDRHRVKPGDKFDKFKDQMDDILDAKYIELANSKPHKFNDIVRAHPIDMKISLYQRDDFRSQVWKVLRMPLQNGRWIDMEKFVSRAIEKNGKKYLFYASGTNGQNIMIHVLNALNIPVLKADTVVSQKNIDVLLLNEIGKDSGTEIRRVDQSLEIVFNSLDSPQAQEIKQRIVPLLNSNEALHVFSDNAIDVPLLCRVSDETVEEDVISEEGKEKKRQLLELLSMFADDEEDMMNNLDAMVAKEKENLIFVNSAHPIIDVLMSINDQSNFAAAVKLLILDAYMQMGIVLNSQQAEEHRQSLMQLINKKIREEK